MRKVPLVSETLAGGAQAAGWVPIGLGCVQRAIPHFVNFLAQAQRTPLIPVFYHAEAAYAQDVLRACYEGGVRVYEYTNRGPHALAIFTELQRFVEAGYPDLLLGAGTIFQPDDAERFIAAGANFIASPVISAEVGAVCARHNLAWLPGAQS